MNFFYDTVKFGINMVVHPITVGDEIEAEKNEQSAAARLGYSVVLMASFSLVSIFFAFFPVMFDVRSVVPSRLALTFAVVLFLVSLWTVLRSAKRWSALSSSKGVD